MNFAKQMDLVTVQIVTAPTRSLFAKIMLLMLLSILVVGGLANNGWAVPGGPCIEEQIKNETFNGRGLPKEAFTIILNDLATGTGLWRALSRSIPAATRAGSRASAPGTGRPTCSWWTRTRPRCWRACSSCGSQVPVTCRSTTSTWPKARTPASTLTAPVITCRRPDRRLLLKNTRRTTGPTSAPSSCSSTRVRSSRTAATPTPPAKPSNRGCCASATVDLLLNPL